MELYVVRHGETEFNVQRRYAGSTDVPLSENGFKQAEELAGKLHSVSIDLIVTSHLLRARQTAEIVQKALAKPLVVIDQFAERNMGVYEGLTREEAQNKYPEMWLRLGARDIDDGPDEGETIRQCYQRVSSALISMKEKYPKSKILLVCHGFVARLINKYCMDLSFEEMNSFTLGNCEYVRYTL